MLFWTVFSLVLFHTKKKKKAGRTTIFSNLFFVCVKLILKNISQKQKVDKNVHSTQPPFFGEKK